MKNVKAFIKGVIEFRLTMTTHYEDNAEKYSKVELGFPSVDPPHFIARYAEDPENLTETVYPFVPVDLVWKMLEGHGGIANGINHFLSKE